MSEPLVDFRKRMVRGRQEELESLAYDSLRWIIDDSVTVLGWSLEAGSGLGRYVHHLSGRGFASVGIEISREIARKAKTLFPASNFIVGDVRQLPIRSHSITNLLSLGVIEHFVDSATLVKESTRVLQTGGVMVTTVPNQYSFWRYIRSYLQRRGKWDIGYERSLTRSELRAILESNGMRVHALREIKAISTILQLLMLFVQRVFWSLAQDQKTFPIRSTPGEFYMPRETAMRKFLLLLDRMADMTPVINKVGFLIVAVSRKPP